MEQAWLNVRTVRDYVLVEKVDYYQSKPLLWDSLTDEQRTEVATYRQALLDFPTTLASIVGDELPLNFTQHLPEVPSWMD
jgi:hypothetical protein